MKSIFAAIVLLIFGVFGLSTDLFVENVNNLDAAIDNLHNSEGSNSKEVKLGTLEIELLMNELNKMKNVYSELFSKQKELMVFFGEECIENMIKNMINIHNPSSTSNKVMESAEMSHFLNQAVFADNVGNLLLVVRALNNENEYNENIINCFGSKTKIELFKKGLDEMVIIYYDLSQKDKEITELMRATPEDQPIKRRLATMYSTDAACEARCHYIQKSVICVHATSREKQCSGFWPFEECEYVTTPAGYYPRVTANVACSDQNRNSYGRFDLGSVCIANCQYQTQANKCYAVTRRQCSGYWPFESCNDVTVGYTNYGYDNLQCS